MTEKSTSWWRKLLGAGAQPPAPTKTYAYRLCAGHHDRIESSLIERGIDASYSQGGTDWRMWRVPLGQLHLLPHDNGEPYLGDDVNGFSLFDMTDQEADVLRRDANHGDWQPVAAPAIGPRT